MSNGEFSGGSSGGGGAGFSWDVIPPELAEDSEIENPKNQLPWSLILRVALIVYVFVRK